MTHSKTTSRREFLKGSTAAVTGAVVTAGGLSLARSAHARGSDQISVALIGCGGRGTGAASNCLNVPDNIKLTVVADAFVGRPSTSDPFLVTCSITTGSNIDVGYEMYVLGPESGHVSGVRVFNVVAGQNATYRLNCTAGAGAPGDLAVKNAHLSAMFTPAA